MRTQLEDHYTQLADTYDDAWSHRPAYLDWMTDHLHSRLAARPGEWLADIGAGTGLFLRRLLPHATPRTPLVCVDPSGPMLARLPRDPRLLPVRASAEELAAGAVDLPCASFDGVLIKEAVHHFQDLEATLAGLARLLAPGGRLLVVTLPRKLDYPLFPAALDRFASRQPEPEAVAAALTAAGLRTAVEYDEFAVTVERDQWLRLVANRWMSVLSTFDDGELDRGLAEIARDHPAQRLVFADRFAFVLGRRPAEQPQ